MTRVLVFVALVAAAALGQAFAADVAGPQAAPAPYTEAVSGTTISFDMLPIPAGEIRMPDPAKKGTFRTVKVGPFYMAKTETTWDAYDAYRLGALDKVKLVEKDAVSSPSNPYGEADRGYGHKGYPVINETYLGAVSYCKWLSAKTGKSYRLPTEAEWEFACRAGQPDPSAAQLAKRAICGTQKTSAVGSREPNAWGLYDMLGNTAEWATDLTGKPVVCGGCFEDKPEKVKPSARKYQTEEWQANDPQDPKSKWWLSDGQFVGFRVICVDGSAQPAVPAPATESK